MIRKLAIALGVVVLVIFSILEVVTQRHSSNAKTETVLFHSAGVAAADFSPDGKLITVSDYNCELTTWNIETGKSVSVFKLCSDTTGSDIVNVLYYDPTGTRILIDSYLGERYPQIIDSQTGAMLIRLDTDKGLRSADWNSDGSRIVTTSGEQSFQIWDTSSGARLLDIAGHSDNINSVSFSLDGQRIVTASEDGTAKIWDAVTGDELLQITGHSQAVLTASFSPDGQQIITTSYDRTIREWDSQAGTELRLFETDGWPLNSSYSIDGKYIVTSVWFADEIIVREAKSGKVVAEFSHAKPQHDHLRFAILSSSNKFIATGAGNEIRIWRIDYK